MGAAMTSRSCSAERLLRIGGICGLLRRSVDIVAAAHVPPEIAGCQWRVDRLLLVVGPHSVGCDYVTQLCLADLDVALLSMTFYLVYQTQDAEPDAKVR